MVPRGRKGRYVQRKVFRVERMLADRTVARSAVDKPATFTVTRSDGAQQSLQREVGELRDVAARTIRDLATLVGGDDDRRLARAAGKLGVAIEGMEKATEAILKSAEVIDESAKALAATSRTDYARGLTQEIQDHVVKLYEACNFQDLGGQQISSVIETLNAIETKVDGMLKRDGRRSPDASRSKSNGELLNGPRLDGESGHTSQHDIDLMFD